MLLKNLFGFHTLYDNFKFTHSYQGRASSMKRFPRFSFKVVYNLGPSRGLPQPPIQGGDGGGCGWCVGPDAAKTLCIISNI